MPDRNAVSTLAAATETPSVTLSAAAADLANAALADNTRRAYSGALRRLDEWLSGEGRVLDDAAIADHLAARFAEGVAPASLGLVVAAVRFTAKHAGLPDPAGPVTFTVLKGARRKGADRGRGQVLGIRWSGADTIAAVAANGGNEPARLRDAALIAVASDAMLRVSEMVAIQATDIERQDDGSGRLTVARSKTDQEAEGAVLYLGPPTMRRISDWTERAGITDGPLFRRIRRGGVVQSSAMTARAARDTIRRRAVEAGIEGRISGHSLRVGSAQSLAAAGASLVEMQTAGRWKGSAMPAHYAKGQLAGRGAIARLRHRAG